MKEKSQGKPGTSYCKNTQESTKKIHRVMSIGHRLNSSERSSWGQTEPPKELL